MDQECRYQFEIDHTGVPVGVEEDLLDELVESRAAAEALADRIRDEPCDPDTLIHHVPRATRKWTRKAAASVKRHAPVFGRGLGARRWDA